MEKLVAIMRRKSDVIIITDCRLKGGVEKIRKFFRVGRGIQYDFYANSSKAERGVCIALSRGRDIEDLQEERDLNDENFLLLRCRLETKEFLLGGVYGPNANNVAFYTNLRDRIVSYGLPFLIVGDFNTVIDGGIGEENLDLEDRAHIPNKDNGKFIREWIEEGEVCDPFRKKYPMSRCMSYVPFRTKKRVNNRWVETNFGKSRLDFYLISSNMFNDIDSVFYGERITRDLDHLEAVIRLGKQPNVKRSILIRNCTFERAETQEISVLGYLDCLNTHVKNRNELLQNVNGWLQGMHVDLCNLRGEIEINGENEQVTNRIGELEALWTQTVRELGELNELNDLELQCSATTFYEVLLNEYKNRLVALQGNLDARKTFKRKWLAKKT